MEQYIVNGLCRGAIYALVALGFSLIYTTSRVFHIAHGFVYVAGAYVMYTFLHVIGSPVVLAVAFALIVASLLALLIEALVYRPLDRRNASSSVLFISSIGVYIVGINVVAMIFGDENKILRAGAEETVQFGNAVITHIQLLQLGVGLLVFLIYWLFLGRTALGRVCRAVADDSTLASVLGIRVEGIRLLVFALGSMLAVSGAILSALDVGIDPHSGLPVVLAAFVACIVGGLNRLLAPALGGLLLGVVQSLVVSQSSAHWESAVTFVILIGVLLFRPQGIFGHSQRLDER